MKTYVGDQPVTFKGAAVRVAPKGARRSSARCARRTATGAELPGRRDADARQGTRRLLRGGFDAAYYLYAYPYQRLVLEARDPLGRGGPPPVVVEAPMCVHATVMRQTKDGKQRLVVHLSTT